MNETNLPPEQLQSLNVEDIAKAVVRLSKWKNYVIYLLLLVAIVLAGLLLWQRGNLAYAKTELAQAETVTQRLQTERDLAMTNETSCRTNLQNQNDQIEGQGELYNKMVDGMGELGKKIDKSIAEGAAYRKSTNVRNQTTPKTCAEVLDFLNRNSK